MGNGRRRVREIPQNFAVLRVTALRAADQVMAGLRCRDSAALAAINQAGGADRGSMAVRCAVRDRLVFRRRLSFSGSP